MAGAAADGARQHAGDGHARPAFMEATCTGILELDREASNSS